MDSTAVAEIERAAENAATLIAREIGELLAEFPAMGGPRFEQLVRAFAVAAVARELSSQNETLTPTRLAARTGFTRSQVEQALSQTQSFSNTIPSRLSEADTLREAIGNVVFTWTTSSRYTIFYEVPLHLNRRRSEDSSPTFSELVSEAGCGFDEERLLDEMLKLGAVEVVADERLALTGAAIREANAEARNISRVGELVAGLLRTLRTNRQRRHDPGRSRMYERVLLTDRAIGDQQLADFKELVMEQGDRWLQMLDTQQRHYFARRNEGGRKLALVTFLMEVPGSEVGPEWSEEETIDLVTAHGSSSRR